MPVSLQKFLPPLILFLGPFVLSWILTACLIRWAPRLGLVDQPDPRKVHNRPTPRGGGLAIYATLVLTTTFLAIGNWLFSRSPTEFGNEGPMQFPIRENASLLALGLVIVVLGLVDDLRPLSWQLRLGVQVLVGGVVVLTWLPPLGWPLRAAALLWVVGLTNAFNMLDNMDALSAGVALIAAGFLALARQPLVAGENVAGPEYLAFMGAVSGFLWFNRPPARIFMGDAGSTFLGFFLGAGSLAVGFENAPDFKRSLPWAWLVPVCVLVVPWYDLITVVALRLWQGRSPFHADKQHLSHRLVALGLTSPAAVRVIYLLALVSGASGLVLYHVTDWTGAKLVAIQLACCWAAVAGIEYVGRRPADKETR